MLDIARSPLDELTPRELTVVELVAQGWSNREIADRLVVTVRTVETHIWAILIKLRLTPDDRINRRVLLSLVWFQRGVARQTAGLPVSSAMSASLTR